MKSTTITHVQSDSQIQHQANAEKVKSAVAQSLSDLFLNELKAAYWSEKALAQAIGKMIAQTFRCAYRPPGNQQRTYNKVRSRFRFHWRKGQCGQV
jgi:hypothetical protein